VIIYYDTTQLWLCFKLEKKDWKHNKGKDFIEEILEQIPGDNRICEDYGRELLWKIDAEFARVFYEIFKKYYPLQAVNKKILFL